MKQLEEISPLVSKQPGTPKSKKKPIDSFSKVGTPDS